MWNKMILPIVLLAALMTALYLVAPSNTSTATAQTSGGTLQCETITKKYSGSVDLTCSEGATAVFGSCSQPGFTVVGDSSDHKTWYLTPAADEAMGFQSGLHCESSQGKLVAQLRCCAVK